MEWKNSRVVAMAALFLSFTFLITGDRVFAAGKERVLYSFCSASDCADGLGPTSNLTLHNGHLYGTTQQGGSYNYGTVFELTPGADGTWTESVLHSFNFDGKDGTFPVSGLIVGPAGHLYGTTSQGGSGQCVDGNNFVVGCGVVFELIPESVGRWQELVIYEFSGDDGSGPVAGLILDAAGNLYGTTLTGGSGGCKLSGCGTVFELTPDENGRWAEKVLHSFVGTDGVYPRGNLVFDPEGNLYGTTNGGGPYNYGTVFKLTANEEWGEKLLHGFNSDGKDGFDPAAGLILDSSGNLYGTTPYGGPGGGGVVFQISHATKGKSAEEVIHSFGSGEDGADPFAGLTFGTRGTLLGVTFGGGASSDGVVFQLKFAGNGRWTETVLHTFSSNGKDGISPDGSLIFDAAGHGYGTTEQGGLHQGGTVFEITP